MCCDLLADRLSQFWVTLLVSRSHYEFLCNAVELISNLYLTACIVVMLPLGWLLAVRYGLGLVGLWTAMSIAWALATVIYLVVIQLSDWQKQADAARKRNNLGRGSKANAIITEPSSIELLETQ
jgi:uncharacterized membrane protein